MFYTMGFIMICLICEWYERTIDCLKICCDRLSKSTVDSYVKYLKVTTTFFSILNLNCLNLNYNIEFDIGRM